MDGAQGRGLLYKTQTTMSQIPTSKTPTPRTLLQTRTPRTISQTPTPRTLSQTPTSRKLSQTPMTISQTPTPRTLSQTPMTISQTPRTLSQMPMTISQTPTPRTLSQTPTSRTLSQTLMTISQTHTTITQTHMTTSEAHTPKELAYRPRKGLSKWEEEPDIIKSYNIFRQEWLEDCDIYGFMTKPTFLAGGDEAVIKHDEADYYRRMYETHPEESEEIFGPYVRLEDFRRNMDSVSLGVFRLYVENLSLIVVPTKVAKQILPAISYHMDLYQIKMDYETSPPRPIAATIPKPHPTLNRVRLKSGCIDDWSIRNISLSIEKSLMEVEELMKPFVPPKSSAPIINRLVIPKIGRKRVNTTSIDDNNPWLYRNHDADEYLMI